MGHYCKESFSFAACSTRLSRTGGDYRRRCKLNPELISTGLLQLVLCNKILLSSLNGFFFFLIIIIIPSSLSLSLSLQPHGTVWVVSKASVTTRRRICFPCFFLRNKILRVNRFLRGKQTGKYNLFRNDFQQKTLANHSKEENKKHKNKKNKRNPHPPEEDNRIILRSPCLLGPSLTL